MESLHTPKTSFLCSGCDNVINTVTSRTQKKTFWEYAVIPPDGIQRVFNMETCRIIAGFRHADDRCWNVTERLIQISELCKAYHAVFAFVRTVTDELF